MKSELKSEHPERERVCVFLSYASWQCTVPKVSILFCKGLSKTPIFKHKTCQPASWWSFQGAFRWGLMITLRAKQEVRGWWGSVLFAGFSLCPQQLYSDFTAIALCSSVMTRASCRHTRSSVGKEESLKSCSLCDNESCCCCGETASSG